MLKLDLFEALGDWNPQLLRELKGRLKPRNLIYAIAISLIIQALIIMIFGWHGQYLCLALSIAATFSLLVFGTGLLISNLAQEERRGTLNFIRLSPRSPQNILWGKILGVPILLYIAVLLAVPLHLWAGIAANIPLIQILSFYGMVVTSCVFFYSLSLLFSLISSQLNGFQAFLGGGTVSLFILMGLYIGLYGDAFDWIKIFSLTVTFRYLISAITIIESRLHWFNLPVGMSLVGITSIAILNYSLWTYWIWQAIKRRFANPNKTILSKIQSYWFVACFEIVALGFAINSIRYYTGGGDSHRYRPGDNLIVLLVYNFVLFCGLIVILTPQRQALIDWARYRNQKADRSLLKDLVWGENSPAIVAIALNGIIATIILIPWIMLEMDKGDRLPVAMSLIFNLCLIVVFAAISQLVVLTQKQKSKLSIVGTISAVIILPPTILFLLPVKIPALWWLFTIFSLNAIANAGVFSIFLALLGQLSIIAWYCSQITRQLKKAGVSNSIGLFAPSKALLP